MWLHCGHIPGSLVGIRGFFSLRWAGAIPYRQPCQRPRGVILVVFGLLRCPAASSSTTRSRACATTTPWGSGTPGRFPRCDEPCESSTAWRCRFLIARRQHPAHASMSRAGHRGHAGPRLEPPQRLGRVPLLLGRRGDVRRLEARRPVVLLHQVRRRRGGAQGGPGADLPGRIMWPPRHWQARGPGADLPNEWCVGIPAAARS